MKTKALKDIALLAVFEIVGVFLLAAGLVAQNSQHVLPFMVFDPKWAMPLVIIGSLALCVGILLSTRLIWSSIKSGEASRSKPNNRH